MDVQYVNMINELYNLKVFKESLLTVESLISIDNLLRPLNNKNRCQTIIIICLDCIAWSKSLFESRVNTWAAFIGSMRKKVVE